MNIKNLSKLVFISILLKFSVSCYGQHKDEYFSVVFLKDDLLEFYKNPNHPNFNRFIFYYSPYTYQHHSGFILKGSAYNNDGSRILNSNITLYPNNPATKNFTSKGNGELHLTATMMNANHMDGCADYLLKPKKYHEGQAGADDYVSYIVKLIGACFAFSEFDLDPCPPEVCSF